jgi:signal transduction histidine kinase
VAPARVRQCRPTLLPAAGRSPYGYLEHLINAFAALVISICVLGAFLIGRKVATHVIAPITRLADAVQDGHKPFPYQDARDEIGVLARAFARHSDELERFLHREQCFSGDASHELRTPLAIIGGAAETLACQLPADSHLVPSAERILRTTQEMQRQLTCLLLLSRAPSTVPRNEVALRPLLESCMERCQPWLSGKPVIVAFDARHDAVLVTNADLAHSVIWNLLRNACQYTESGEVRITLHDAALIVADTGPGLPPASIHGSSSASCPQRAQRRGAGVVDRAAHRRAPGLEDDGAFLAAGMPVQPGVAPLTIS